MCVFFVQVSANISSSLVNQGTLGVALSFGGGTGHKSGANWTTPDAHTSQIVIDCEQSKLRSDTSHTGL